MHRYRLVTFTLLGALSVAPAFAASIINGTFDADLSGWNIEGNAIWRDGKAELSTGAGTAFIAAELIQGSNRDFSDFRNAILIDSPNAILTFDLEFTDAGGEEESGARGSDVLDVMAVSADDASGASDLMLASFDSTSNRGGRGLSFSIGSLFGQRAAIFFILRDLEDDRNSSVTIDNVAISDVPVPAALPLFLTGFSLIGAMIRRRSSREKLIET